MFLVNFFGDTIITEITRLNINDCFNAIDNIVRESRYAYPKNNFVPIMNSYSYSNSYLRRNLNVSSKLSHNIFNGIPIDEEKGIIIAEKCKLNFDEIFDIKIVKIDIGDNTKARYKKTLRAITNYAHNTLVLINDNPMAGNKITIKRQKEKKVLSDMFGPVVDKDNKSKIELDIERYNKVKEDMKRKGFTDIDEYYDYLDFMEQRKNERNNT